MATMIQTPDSLSLLMNLKSFIVSSTTDISFALSCSGETIVEETYTPDSNGRIEIQVRDLLARFLETRLPSSNQYVQADAVRTFSASVNGNSVSSFTVVNGGVRKLSVTPENFLKANWLTWQPQSKRVGWDSPEYLSYYFAVAGTVKAKFYYKTGGTKVVTVASGTAGQLQTFNMAMSRLFSVGDVSAEDMYGLVDVWVDTGAGVQLSYVQRFVFSEKQGDEHVYLAVNSLGGIDTFTFHGERKTAADVEHEAAELGDTKIDITAGAVRHWEQNTGHLGTEESSWIYELISAKRTWAVMDGQAEAIVIDADSNEYSDLGTLSTGSFSYYLSEEGGLQNIGRETGQLPVIEVPSATGDIFFLEARLIDYPDADLSENLLLLAQSPFSRSWYRLDLESTLDWICSSVVASPIGQMAHEHENLLTLGRLSESSGRLAYRGEALAKLSDIPTIPPPTPTEHWFDPVMDENEQHVVGMKALFDIEIIQEEADEELGTDETTKNISEILRHLSLKEADGEIYLSSDIGFASDGFISGAGLSSGGGDGSAAAMATLIDVTLDNLQNGDILRYNLSTQRWINSTLILGAAASYGIGQVVQGDAGLVTGGDVYAAIASYLSAAIHFAGITTTALTDGSTNPTVTIDNESYTANRGDEVIYGGKEFLWTGAKWQQLGDEESWALKTITFTGTGYLTGGGTLEASRTIDIAEGIKTKIEAGNTAYGWGDHALAGYASATALTAVSDRVTTLEGRTNWDDYLEIVNGDIHVKSNRGFYSDSFISGGGLSQTSGGGGVNLEAVWNSLTNAVQDAYANAQIAPAHLTTALANYATKAWVEGQGFLKVEDFDLLPLTTGLATVTGRVRSLEEWTERPYVEEFRTDSLTTDFVNTQALLLNGRRVLEPVETATLYDVQLQIATAAGSLAARIGSLEYWTERPSMSEATIETLTAHSANIGGAVTSYVSDMNALSVAASLRTTGRLYIGTTGAYIELTNDGYLHTNRGFYSDSFVSGGGLSQTGGSSGISAQMMWELLAASTGEQVAASHLSSALSAYATQQWVISQGYLTSADFDMLSVSMGLESAHKRIDSIEDWMERPAVDELYADMVNTRQLLLNGRAIGSIVTGEDLNSWSGSANITKLGTITSGIWHGTSIANDYLANSAITLAGRSVSLGGSISASNMRYDLSISNVENTALSTWGGSSYISTVGTITSGTWHGSAITNSYLANSSISIAGNSVSLGGTLSAQTLLTSLGLDSLYLSLGGGTLTGDLYLRGGNYGRHIYFGDGSYCYLGELTDDVMTLYGSKGINFLTSSSSYGVTIGSKVNNVITATPLTLWGKLNLTDASYIEYNSTNGAIYSNKGIYSDGFISGGGFSNTSDIRLKKDIRTIDNRKAWDVVSSLRPVEFRWIKNSAKSAGFIAQDVEQHVPFAVFDVDGMKRLQYDVLFTYGLAALGGLRLEVDTLKTRVDKLEKRVNAI